MNAPANEPRRCIHCYAPTKSRLCSWACAIARGTTCVRHTWVVAAPVPRAVCSKCFGSAVDGALACDGCSARVCSKCAEVR